MPGGYETLGGPKMPVEMKILTEKSRALLHDLALGAYLDGECYAFAVAVSQGLGWPMLGLMAKDVPRHVVLQTPVAGTYFDVRGMLSSEKEAAGPFGLELPLTIKPVTASDLCRVRPINKFWVARTRRMAEMIWPNLPWKESLSEKVRAFLEGLEQLSTKHGLYIRSMFPTAQPVLSESDSSEAGYVCEPTDDGLAFMFDRKLS